MTVQQPRHSEPSANNELGDLLRGMLFGCQVRSENTQLIDGQPSLQLDNLITAPDRAPVVVEAEYAALGSGEADALGRLGLPVVNETHSIEAAIALRYPDSVRFADDLRSALNSARLSYAVFYDDDDNTRFPGSGWLEGSVSDLADLIRLVSVPHKAVNAAADALEDGIDKAATILNQMAENRPNTSAAIARLLGMADVTQTRRMASAILANALVFHERIAGMHDGVNNLELVCGPDVSNPKSATLAAWAAILDINYWSIFAIARDILTQLPASEASRVLNVLRNTAEEFGATGVNNAHDLTGRIFQRLIADRKYLATFYTLPASAALLARLAVAKMDGIDWFDGEAIGRLRIGDFACGTGALLSAVYDQIAARHERAGGDPSAIHVQMMEEVLYGCDVMPSAIHITGSTLSGAYPDIEFGQSRLYTMPYGRQSDGSVSIGSAELLRSSGVQTLFNTSDPALRTGSVGEQTAAQVTVEIPDEGFDLVIMNPPFTRAGSDWEGNDRDEDYVKQFRGLSTDLDTQKDMSKKLSAFSKRTCYHGYAGIASAFAALAHRKIKRGGVLALVLPLSAAAGLSWQKFRKMLADHYEAVEVWSISANGSDTAFSSDTGMAECLVVARRKPDGTSTVVPALFASLTDRPSEFVASASIASAVSLVSQPRGINDGPFGGTPLSVGNEKVGELLTVPLPDDGAVWGGVRLRDCSLAQIAHSMSHGRLWLPAQARSLPIPMARLDEIGSRGWHDMNIVGAKAPFTKAAPSQTSTYPCLWNHDAKKETYMICAPDFQLQVRQGMEDRAVQAWSTASHAHLNRDFRFNSQPLTVAFTDRPSVGGIAWPNVRLPHARFDCAFTVWGNSTLGMMCYWWNANKQHDGRGRTTVSGMESLPVLDLRSLTEGQFATAQAILDEFRDLELQPAYLADADPNRALLDRRVVCDLLGFDEEIYRAVRSLSAKWCAEPSVHGGKARPKSASLII